MHTKVLTWENWAPRSLSRYGIALLSVTLAAVFTLALRRWDYPANLGLFYGAVMASAWFGGFLPSLLATTLSAPLIIIIFQPFFSLSGFGPYNSARFALFVLMSIVVSWLGEARLRSEAAHRAAAQHYRQLFDQNLAGVFLSTLEGQILDCNEAFARIFGYDSPKEVLTHSALDFYFNSTQRESYIERLMAEGSITAFDERLKGKDDRPVWIILNASLIEDDVGARKLLQGTIIDITERKRAEEALRKAERNYRDIFEHAVEGVFRTTREGKFITANPALASMLGYDSPADLLSDRGDLAHHVYVDSRRREEFKRQLDKHGMIRNFEFEVTRLDGKTIWISDNVRAVLDDDGDFLYYEGSAEDITERKRTQEALRDSEERYRELFENAHDAIYVHDLSGNYLSVNRAAEKLSGYSSAEIIGRNAAEFIAPEHLKEIRARMREKVAGKGQSAYEIEIIAKDGHRVHVEVDSRLILENGVAVGVQGMARDISDRKRAEEAMRTFPRRLIGAQEAERRRVARELHDEIGQALTAIRINLQSLQQSSSEEELATHLDGSIKIVDLALQQVRDLALDLRPSLLDDLGLNAALRWYLDRETTRAGLTLELSLNLEGTRLAPEIETTCFRIVQEALTNILRHAHAKKVSVELALRDSGLRLSIRDDGVGFNVDAALHRFKIGASLGLQGMQERALAVGGTIEILSTKAKGTEVRVQLPIRPILLTREE